MRFDMMRVRQAGIVVPRHNMGMLRTVRGTLLVGDKHFSDLHRHARVATFVTECRQTLELIDASLVHATAETIVLTGFERDSSSGRDVDFAQTWVLVECVGDKPDGTMGPKFMR